MLPHPKGVFTAACRYNKSQIRTRNSVERAFGVWKRRFACLKTKLQTETDRSAAIITACAALHNFAHALREPCPDGPGPEPEDSDSGTAGHDTQLGSRMRRHLIQRCFSSVQGNSSISMRGAGAVPSNCLPQIITVYCLYCCSFFLCQNFCATLTMFSPTFFSAIHNFFINTVHRFRQVILSFFLHALHMHTFSLS